VQAAPATLTLVRHRAQPIASIARLSITATCAYSLGRLLPTGARSVLAPLTAVIVVQVTMYQTIRSALQRVVSVIAGVLVALAFSVVVGFTWWSLAILIAAGLAIGYALRLGIHMFEVPISAMLILSLDTRTAAILRILETLIGAGTGMLGGLVFAPLRVQLAEEAVDDLSRPLSGLLEQMATDLVTGLDEGAAEDRLYRARQVVGEIQKVDPALAEAAESLQLTPRGRSLAHASVALRDGLETLEHAAVTARDLSHGR
jgi:uncharacterized membrane protein YgaE (UPF0421/DUF939 family)